MIARAIKHELRLAPTLANLTKGTDRLITIEGDPKTIKGESRGYLTGVYYGAPAKVAGLPINACPFATKGCSENCLGIASGRALWDCHVIPARIRRERLRFYFPDVWRERMERGIGRLVRLADRKGLIPVFRPNGSTDRTVPDWILNLVDCYDYTKVPSRILTPNPRLDLTFSRSEDNERECMHILRNNLARVAIVFKVRKGEPLPKEYKGIEVLDGDTSDLRFLEPKGVWIGVRAKGRAKDDSTGFAIDCSKL
jgi:hypothetical protein